MYESFFGLRERPFDLVPNPRFLFLGALHREALGNLRLGLTTPRGITLMVGEAGTGKTTLLQATLSDLDESQVEYLLVSNPTLKRDEFYEMLAREFKLTDATAGSKARFLLEFRKHLLERHERGLLTALILDEAQSLPIELLEEVRLLSNIETPTSKLLNVVLVGQPELSDRLNDSALRQLKQRVSLRCELRPLNLQGTAAYIADRLRTAGGSPASIFSREAVYVIFEASRGLPRTIGVLSDNALISGFAQGERPVGARTVEEVCRDFDLLRAADPPPPAPGVASTAATARRPVDTADPDPSHAPGQAPTEDAPSGQVGWHSKSGLLNRSKS